MSSAFKLSYVAWLLHEGPLYTTTLDKQIYWVRHTNKGKWFPLAPLPHFSIIIQSGMGVSLEFFPSLALPSDPFISQNEKPQSKCLRLLQCSLTLQCRMPAVLRPLAFASGSSAAVPGILWALASLLNHTKVAQSSGFRAWGLRLTFWA